MMVHGIPKFISFPVNTSRSPSTSPKPTRRRRAYSTTSSSIIPLSLTDGSGRRSASRWLSCNSAPAGVEVRRIRSITDTKMTSQAMIPCDDVSSQLDKHGSSLPSVVVPPRLPRRLQSNLELDDSDDEQEEKMMPQKNATFVASSTANDSSPKIPRRSWTFLTWSDTSLPNLGSLERHADASTEAMVASAAPPKEDKADATESSPVDRPSRLQSLKTELSRRHSAPALVRSVAAAIAA